MRTVEKYVEIQTPDYYLKNLLYRESYNREWNEHIYGIRTMILQSDYVNNLFLKMRYMKDMNGIFDIMLENKSGKLLVEDIVRKEMH